MNDRKQRTWRIIAAACIAAAGCVIAVWWPHFLKRTQDWSPEDRPAANVIRATALCLALGGAIILALTNRRRGPK